MTGDTTKENDWQQAKEWPIYVISCIALLADWEEDAYGRKINKRALVNRHYPAPLHGPMVILILDWTKEGTGSLRISELGGMVGSRHSLQ
jgi:hypothetical protein